MRFGVERNSEFRTHVVASEDADHFAVAVELYKEPLFHVLKERTEVSCDSLEGVREMGRVVRVSGVPF